MLINLLLLSVVVAVTWSLLWVKPNVQRLIRRPRLSDPFLDVEWKYQVLTLLPALAVLGLVFAAAPDAFRRYASLGDLSAAVEPVPALGILPGPGETWLQIGANFAVVITLVTFVFIYLQLIRGRKVTRAILRLFPWVLVLALMNSFTEEAITRFSVVALLDGILPLGPVYLVSALIFGTVHYFGTPGRIPGVLLAGFLGWFLAKSIGETQGIFWAWTIHFLQDVVIFTGLFFRQFAETARKGRPAP